MTFTSSFSIPDRPAHQARGIFSHLVDSIDRSQAKRPLGIVSDFVAEQLPHHIAQIKGNERPDEAVKELGQSINAMIRGTDCEAQLINLPQSDFGVAKTDIQYLVNCAYQMSAFAGLNPVDAELTVGEPLMRIAQLSRQRQPSIDVLSYEDMILTNPVESDPRVYCLGSAGVEERDFCLGHQLIEGDLQSAIEALLELRDTVAADARKCLSLCMKSLESAIYILERFYEHMSHDLFGQFRMFYGKNPYKDRLGPSGRFSARIVAVSVLLIGEELLRQKPQFYKDVYRLSEYYPQKCIGDVFRWLSPDKVRARTQPSWLEGKAPFPKLATVSSIVERQGSEIRELHASCVCALDRFTRMHRRAALKYTVGPGLPIVGVDMSESIEAVLSQRLLGSAPKLEAAFSSVKHSSDIRRKWSMSQDEVVFRRFEVGDAEDVWRLHRSASDAVGVHGPEGAWEDDLRNVGDVYLASGGDFVVAHIGGQLVAMGGLKPAEDYVAELKRMRVDPAFQQRGLGRRILSELELRAVALGFKCIMLDTTTIQVGAQKLYETSGYSRRGEGMLHGYAVIFFEKRLASQDDLLISAEKRPGNSD
ncbi:GNAT family N-acetyltransferase [Mesorhizobium sp. M0115]|uniref:GNAT family N-acetyltransferase n=1 Tax=unclassified Mesorhizobium TaxID=325217 RepID=UPI00333DA1BA